MNLSKILIFILLISSISAVGTKAKAKTDFKLTGYIQEQDGSGVKGAKILIFNSEGKETADGKSKGEGSSSNLSSLEEGFSHSVSTKTSSSGPLANVVHTMKVKGILAFMGLSSVNAALLSGRKTERSDATSVDFSKKMARARLEKANLPDPVCRTGIISTPILSAGKKQACCPHYCKECDDYPTCKKVRGQDSKNACCASDVLKMACGKGAPANVCVKKCSESLPPCIMEDGKVWKLEPPEVNAAEDCNEAITDWRKHKQAAIKTGKMEADVIDGKTTLKQMDAAITDHGKLSDEVKETVTEVKKTISDAEAIIDTVKDDVKEVEADIEIAESMEPPDALAERLLGEMESSLKTIESNVTKVLTKVKEFNANLESTREALDSQLAQLKDHKNTAAADVKMAVDFKADLRQSHEMAEKIRKMQHEAETHEAELKKIFKEAEAKAEKIKEEAIAMKTTTTTTNLNCECYLCGSTDPFPDADVCGQYTESGEYPCGPETSGSGCWTYAPQGCVCSTQTIIQECQCYHCGGMEEFNDADVCGTATTSGEYPCGPETPGSGCWASPAGCDCGSRQTTR
jgi:hypothetical protein